MKKAAAEGEEEGRRRAKVSSHELEREGDRNRSDREQGEGLQWL